MTRQAVRLPAHPGWFLRFFHQPGGQQRDFRVAYFLYHLAYLVAEGLLDVDVAIQLEATRVGIVVFPVLVLVPRPKGRLVVPLKEVFRAILVLPEETPAELVRPQWVSHPIFSCLFTGVHASQSLQEGFWDNSSPAERMVGALGVCPDPSLDLRLGLGA